LAATVVWAWAKTAPKSRTDTKSSIIAPENRKEKEKEDRGNFISDLDAETGAATRTECGSPGGSMRMAIRLPFFETLSDARLAGAMGNGAHWCSGSSDEAERIPKQNEPQCVLDMVCRSGRLVL
jgi:hypothetical protein